MATIVWVELAAFPQAEQITPRITVINKAEFCAPNGSTHCIGKYDIIKQKWSSWLDFSNINERYADYIVSHHPNKDRTYVLTTCPSRNSTKLVLPTTNKTNKLFELQDIGLGACGTVINDRFQIFGGEFNNKHLIWNENTKTFKINHQFEFHSCWFHELIYIESKQQVLMIGGMFKENRFANISIQKSLNLYNIQDNKWTKLNVVLPEPLCMFGCIISRNDEFVILFGGATTMFADYTEYIQILNMKTMTFILSRVRCPTPGKFKAVKMEDIERERMLNFGFVRNAWKQNGIENVLFPPVYIIEIIASYYNDEWIYLLNECGHLWKGKLDPIVSPPYDVFMCAEVTEEKSFLGPYTYHQ